MLDLEALQDAFREQHGAEPRLFYAPGRVNLIGEHTDYNSGFVLPMAIDRGTAVAAARRRDRRIVVTSRNLGEQGEIDLDGRAVARRGIWLDYVEGVARALEARGLRLEGADLVVESDIPAGAGLSSSAALEVSVGLALLSLAGHRLEPSQLALACQEAEQTFVGTQCGIMDQLIAALGCAGHALLIDCRSLAVEPIAAQIDGYALLVCDTRIKHSLASSSYNRRREECEEAVRLLNTAIPGAQALRDVDLEMLERHRSLLPEAVFRRCRHVVTENGRTLAAAEALRAGNVDAVGQLMYASHESLRDDYEVSCTELDRLVDVARSLDGTVGARMTGGGFGGCTICLVQRSALWDVRSELSSEFEASFGRAPFAYTVELSDGAREICGL